MSAEAARKEASLAALAAQAEADSLAEQLAAAKSQVEERARLAAAAAESERPQLMASLGAARDEAARQEAAAAELQAQVCGGFNGLGAGLAPHVQLVP